MARLGRQLVDGRGASRVADALLSEAPAEDWAIRPALARDAEAIWEIAADPAVRRLAFSPGGFGYPEHERWFLERLARTDYRFWVSERDGVVGGFVRYNADQAAVINVAVAAPFRGQRVGRRLLAGTWPSACRELGTERARAVVFEENRASQSAFAHAGFVETARRSVDGRRCVVFEAGMRDRVE